MWKTAFTVNIWKLSVNDHYQISSPLVNISASVGHGAYALGYQTAFDAGIATVQSLSCFKAHFLGIIPFNGWNSQQILCISMMDKRFVSYLS